MTNAVLQEAFHPFMASSVAVTDTLSALLLLFISFIVAGYLVSKEFNSWNLKRKQGKSQFAKTQQPPQQPTVKDYVYLQAHLRTF